MAEYIDREAAVTVCNEQYKECLRKSDFCGDTVAWNICADIKAIPAADVAPVVHGRWEGYTHSRYIGCDEYGEPKYADGIVYYCSNRRCRRKSVIKERYCPSCGRKMDGGDGDAAD